MAPEIYHYYCKGIEIHASVQNRTLNAYYENQTLGFDENVDCLQVKPVHVSQTLDKQINLLFLLHLQKWINNKNLDHPKDSYRNHSAIKYGRWMNLFWQVDGEAVYLIRTGQSKNLLHPTISTSSVKSQFTG